MYKLLFVLLFFNLKAFSFSGDTIYFNKKWKECSKSKMYYQRVSEVKDSICLLRDYYKNGNLQFEGTFVFDTSNFSYRTFLRDSKVRMFTRIGEHHNYYDNGNLKKIVIYDLVKNRKKVESKLGESLIGYDSTVFRSMTYTEQKYKNGKGYFKALMLDDCVPHGIYKETNIYNIKTAHANYFYGEIDSIEFFYIDIIDREVVSFTKKIPYYKMSSEERNQSVKNKCYYSNGKFVRCDEYLYGLKVER